MAALQACCVRFGATEIMHYEAIKPDSAGGHLYSIVLYKCFGLIMDNMNFGWNHAKHDDAERISTGLLSIDK